MLCPVKWECFFAGGESDILCFTISNIAPPPFCSRYLASADNPSNRAALVYVLAGHGDVHENMNFSLVFLSVNQELFSTPTLSTAADKR